MITIMTAQYGDPPPPRQARILPRAAGHQRRERRGSVGGIELETIDDDFDLLAVGGGLAWPVARLLPATLAGNHRKLCVDWGRPGGWMKYRMLFGSA
jgi:hypothetical protein